MYWRMCVISLVPLTWCRPPRQYLVGKRPPLGVGGLISYDGLQIKARGEHVCLSSGVADEALRVKLLGYSHRLLGADAKLTRGLLLQLLREESRTLTVVPPAQKSP